VWALRRTGLEESSRFLSMRNRIRNFFTVAPGSIAVGRFGITKRRQRLPAASFRRICGACAAHVS
jgi:hypothetical protein